MAIFIKKIELNNWFGYFGPYENNVFEFSNGVNIVVAPNDTGKSKLHNAFRWMLTDNVILKNNLNKYELLNIDLNTINHILNHESSALLKNQDTVTIGVRIYFEETNSRGESLNRIITKEVLCKKDVNRITIATPKTSVQRIELGNIRTAPETFDELKTKIIRPNLLDFFLVQGESLEHLTPLKGEKLRTTINNLVSLNILDKKSDISIKLASNIFSLRQDIEKRESINNTAASENVLKKTTLENEITEITESELPQLNNFKEIFGNTIEEFRGQAEISRKNQALLKIIDNYNLDIKKLEGAIDNSYKYLVDNYINNEFWLSKITDNKKDKKTLTDFKENLRDFSAKRGTELNDTLSEKERKMLYALERDQPSPAILTQMIVDDTCYICANNLSADSKRYMEEKLIPFFRKELNKDDIELNKYVELNEIYLKLDGYLNKYDSFEYDFLQSKINSIVLNESNKRDIENKKDDFIKENGVLSKDDVELVSLTTYDRAKSDLSMIVMKIELLEDDLSSKISDLATVNSNMRASNMESKDSVKLNKARNLETFGTEIKNVLLDIKKQMYEDFAMDLEKISNKKFQAFSKDNERFTSQKIKVDFSLNHDNQPDFEIKVIDQFGNNLQQGGGASQALRQLSVIFGLIEKAGGNVNFPFIADAPTSNMSHTLSEHFFNYQLENSENQNILITKELWDDKKNTLNEIGERILTKVENIENAKMISIVSKKGNNKRVNILNLNN